ncbi:MAG: alpha/beta fold hydrolase [Ilumatobacter sp.]|uniref:PHA/PHB synthase family protein n=1 Tax=Ilumatobacter sp. TaxID=1967498 RepID=UPI003C76B731
MSTSSKNSTQPADHVEEPVQTDGELIGATIDAVTSNLPVGLEPTQILSAGARFLRSTATQPQVVARRALGFVADEAAVLMGRSEIAPAPKDRRFTDDAWSTNPFFKRLAQTYLAADKAVHGIVADLDIDDKTRLRTEFIADLLTDAAAPTNTLAGNPAALKEARRTNGQSLVDGARHAMHDLRNNGGMPSMVDSRPFTPGDTVACTPGSVVFRNEVLEVIQYAPATAKVGQRPLLVVPPQINKYYVLDLAPGRSLFEHLVGEGHQVFAISWRNPGPEQRDWNLDTYCAAIIEAIDAALEITGAKDLNMLGVCAGGITQAALLAHLAAIDDDRIRSASFLVTIIDWDVPSMMGTMISRPVVEAATRRSQRQGVLKGSDLSKIFAWLRPNDLVWNYVANNYLMGKNPPAFDVLAWNGDTTNLPAGLHADFMNIAIENAMTEAGIVNVLETPVDLGAIECPSFVVGAVTDHITPWEGCYQTVNLLGGESEFVLSSQGHIQALVNPAGNPKGKYYLNTATPDTAEEWRADAVEHAGSWWDHWTVWLEAHLGRKVNAPDEQGSESNPIIMPAPGAYVLN